MSLRVLAKRPPPNVGRDAAQGWPKSAPMASLLHLVYATH